MRQPAQISFRHRLAPYGVDDHWRMQGEPARTVCVRSAAVETGRQRLTIVAALFLIAFSAVAWRTADLTLGSDLEPRPSRGSAAKSLGRADIVDRNGALLARDVTTVDVSLRPSALSDPMETARRIVRAVPEIDAAGLLERFANPNFAYVLRDATPKQHQALFALGIESMNFTETRQRAYPKGSLFSHVIGYVDVDNRGIAGLELGRDEDLKGRALGEPLALSLDADVQYAVREEIAAGVETYGAEAGIAVVLDVTNGEVVALVSLPDFDPSRPGDASEESRKNRATADVFEMGSTFKPFTFAAGFEHDLFDLDDGFDATKPIRIGGRTIRDFYPEKRWLTVTEVFIHSSNIGTAQMSQLIGGERQRRFLGEVGLLDRSPLELPEVADPIVQGRWGPVETATISYGYGLSVSPLQLASGLATLVNGGRYIAPTVLKRGEGSEPAGRRVISAATSEKIRRLMRTNVMKGTGSSADVQGYEVGGKTGTAQKLENGRYDPDARVSSFASIFPARSPRYLMLVMLDRPTRVPAHPGLRPTGGATAAPLSGLIIARIAPMMGLVPLRSEPAWQTVAFQPESGGARSQ